MLVVVIRSFHIVDSLVVVDVDVEPKNRANRQTDRSGTLFYFEEKEAKLLKFLFLYSQSSLFVHFGNEAQTEQNR